MCKHDGEKFIIVHDIFITEMSFYRLEYEARNKKKEAKELGIIASSEPTRESR